MSKANVGKGWTLQYPRGGEALHHSILYSHRITQREDDWHCHTIAAMPRPYSTYGTSVTELIFKNHHSLQHKAMSAGADKTHRRCRLA